jgi:hypothetical protein
VKDWDAVEHLLAPAFATVELAVRERFPTILGGGMRWPATPREPFAYVMGFAKDYSHQDTDDIVISVRCHPADSGLEGRSGGGYVPPDAVADPTFEIERGSGETLHLTGPQWLMSGADDYKSWSTVNNFINRVARELKASIPLILQELEEVR